ncbi:UNVERIFIED_CONTAM: Cullin-3A [Sesamum latifolium]|uniref:Cullin-3A n=1 Tax=Sesamum latifolium TaxID=2727402 RepID=A0AAW2SRS0_9LAMI
MFIDMKTSQDAMQGFYAAYGAELGNGPTLVVQVLTTDSCPTQSSITCNLPSEMSALCQKYELNVSTYQMCVLFLAIGR